MAVWTCPTILDCDCLDNPFRNLSAEDPDPPNHFARSFPSFPTLINSPIDTYKAPGCVGDCFSVVSQFDADACALRQATQCNYTTPTGTPPGPQLFGNDAQSCQVECAMGDPFIYTVPAGTYLAPTVDLANVIARSFCYNQAFSLRHCETPPGPPVTVCPRITGVSPAGPITANTGDNVTLTATYSFPGSASALMFIWFLDGVPIAILHDDPTLFLTDVMESDSGDYTLAILANGCSPVFSNNIALTVSNCPAETGSPAPTTLDIEHPVEWETWTITNADLSVAVSSNIICNPTGLFEFTPSNGLDHAPGNYGYRYVAGALRRPGLDGGCGANVWVEPPGDGQLDIANQEHNLDAPNPCDFQVISGGSISGWFFMPGDPPPGGFAGGLGGCFISSAVAQGGFQGALNGYVHVEGTYPPDQIEVFPHSNLGGDFFGYMTDYGDLPAQFIDIPFELKVLQIEGNIPQPRKLSIFNYAALVPQFSNPSAASNWDGTFQTRDNYDSTTLNWLAPAGGSFGGSKLEWTNAHPSSANGFGWKLTMFNSVFAPYWIGYKGVDATSEGRYYRDPVSSPAGPECLVVDDISDTLWYPGTHP